MSRENFTSKNIGNVITLDKEGVPNIITNAEASEGIYNNFKAISDALETPKGNFTLIEAPPAPAPGNDNSNHGACHHSVRADPATGRCPKNSKIHGSDVTCKDLVHCAPGTIPWDFDGSMRGCTCVFVGQGQTQKGYPIDGLK